MNRVTMSELRKRKIPEAAGPRGAKDSGYFREAIANCGVFNLLNLIQCVEGGRTI